MVPAQQGEAFLVARLVKEHQGHCLDRVVATVNVITEEQVVRLRRAAADAEELLQVQPM